ncbi:uncharacterized protein [Anser cygnoides]|uniref:uncharacterized protein isoform X14 n=1 Tax=Anser cygnoides TaxID=8845 RepID=UPI0034D1C31E
MRCPSEPSLRAGAFHDWLGTQGGSGVTASLNSGRKRSVIGSEEPRAEVPCRACRHYGRKLSARAGLGSGRAAEARCRNEGRSSSPPLGPPRGLSPSEGGAAAEGRKAAAGVLQSQVSQEKEQADCPEDLLQRQINPVRSVPDSCQWDHPVVAGKIQEQDGAWKNVTYGGAGNSLLLGNRFSRLVLPPLCAF